MDLDKLRDSGEFSKPVPITKDSTQPIVFFDPQRKPPKVLLVEDEDYVLSVLRRQLNRGGYDCEAVASVDEALPLLETFAPEVVVSDINLGSRNGIELLDHVRAFDAEMEVVLMTGLPDMRVAIDALKKGASDYLIKPVQPELLFQSINSALERRSMRQELRKYQHHLEEMVHERTQEVSRMMEELLESHEALLRSHRETLDRLLRVNQCRDNDTGFHIQRIGRSCSRIGHAMGLAGDFVQLLGQAAPLHDVGKIAIPDSLLHKKGELTRAEFETMQSHTIIGAQILGGGETPLIRMSAQIALTHHEQWDGGGYPKHLKGETIPLEGRICAVADVFDALTHERPYKEAYTPGQAVEMMRHERARHFDPDVLDAFLTVVDEIAGLDAQLHRDGVRYHGFLGVLMTGTADDLRIGRLMHLLNPQTLTPSRPSRPATRAGSEETDPRPSLDTDMYSFLQWPIHANPRANLGAQTAESDSGAE